MMRFIWRAAFAFKTVFWRDWSKEEDLDYYTTIFEPVLPADNYLGVISSCSSNEEDMGLTKELLLES